MFSTRATTKSTGTYSDNIQRLREALAGADAVVIGAGAGLSTSAGFVYSGERFEKHFADFGKKFGFSDMYSGGFYPYETPEELWAFWSRNIWVNRYMDMSKPVYEKLLDVVRGKDYFVLTTNVDHCFRKRALTSSAFFTHRGITAFGSAASPVMKKPTRMKRPSGR